jgi:hypothetical protein
MGLQRVPLSDFSGGLNTKDGPFNLEPNEAQDLMNVVLTERGALEQRTGKTRFDTSGAPATSIQHIRNWYPIGADKRLICSIDGDIYSCDTSGVLTLLFNGGPGSTWAFEQAEDVSSVDTLWCLDGSNAKRITSAGVVSNWGGAPPTGTMMRLWKNRMCVAGLSTFPQRLFYSDIANPELPNTGHWGTNFIDIKTTDDDEDPITWLEVIGDYLLVFKKQSIWQVYDSNSFANQRLGGPGCEGRFMSCVSEGRCYYFHRSGVWSTSGSDTPVYEAEAIENYITDNLNHVHIEKARVTASRDRRIFVALPFGAATSNNRLLELVPYLRRSRREGARASNGAWTVHDYQVSTLATFRPQDVDVLIAGDTTEGLMQLFDGINDDGVAIEARWKFGWRAILGEEPYERLRRVNVEMSGNCVVSVFTDFSPGAVFSEPVATTADPDGLWDGGTWDDGTWDTLSNVELRRIRPETRGRYHCVEFKNLTLDQSFKILRGELVIRGGKEH